MRICKNCAFYRNNTCLLDATERGAAETCQQWMVSRELVACDEFAAAFDRMQRNVHKNACEHGWHDTELHDATAIALIHAEASEALEAARHGNPASEHIPEFSGIEEELADIVIRCMDYAATKGLRLSRAIAAKHEFNKSRDHKHGGKVF